MLLRWGKSDKELLDKSLQEIKKETKSMQKIIENLLQISRYESGRQKPDYIPELDFVLEEDGKIIGHIIYVKAKFVAEVKRDYADFLFFIPDFFQDFQGFLNIIF